MYGLSATIVAFAIYTFKYNRADSLFVTLSVMILASFLHLFWDSSQSPKFNDIDSNPYIWELWYLGFATLDFLFVGLVALLLYKLRSRFSKFVLFILLGYFSMGLMQVATYLEGLLWRGEFFYKLYYSFIPTVNFMITICVIYAVVYRLKAQKIKEV